MRSLVSEPIEWFDRSRSSKSRIRVRSLEDNWLMAEITNESSGEMENMRALIPAEFIGGVALVEEVELAASTRGPFKSELLATPGEAGTICRLSRDSVAEWVIKFGSGEAFLPLPLAAADEHRATELKSRSN